MDVEPDTQTRLKNFGRLRRSRVLRWLLKGYIRFLKTRGGSREIALGFALGLFIAMTPTIGFQMALAILLAALFKISKISAALGVWLTNPLTAPFLYGMTYWIGAKLLGLRTLRGMHFERNLESLIEVLKKAPELLGAMMLGGIILGLPVAVMGYFIAYKAIEKYQFDLKAKLQRQKERLQNKRRQRQLAKKNKPLRRKRRADAGGENGPDRTAP